MNSWNEVVDRFRIKSERFDAAKLMSDGRIGARANRGLGLYYCKLAAEAHGGTIEVWSNEDFPTKFTVRLPGAAR